MLMYLIAADGAGIIHKCVRFENHRVTLGAGAIVPFTTQIRNRCVDHLVFMVFAIADGTDTIHKGMLLLEHLAANGTSTSMIIYIRNTTIRLMLVGGVAAESADIILIKSVVRWDT